MRWLTPPDLRGSIKTYTSFPYLFYNVADICRRGADPTVPGGEEPQPAAGGDAGGAGGQPQHPLLQQDHRPAHQGQDARPGSGRLGAVAAHARTTGQAGQHLRAGAAGTDCRPCCSGKGERL